MRTVTRDKRLHLLVLALLLVSSLAARSIEPGFNLFSKQQDIELGRQAARDIEKQVRVVNDQRTRDYVSRIGKRLTALSPAPDYPYTFKVVADRSINAFALPGGPIYIHTGTIAVADNEAQLAGVIAHEIGHVALRHSTNQASKALLVRMPLALFGGALGGDSVVKELARLGLGFGINSAFLKYSRDAERDADILGARMLARAGYNPIEMARFFEKLEASSGRRIQFFSDHPNPGNRVNYVEEEIRRLPARDYSTGGREFYGIRERARRR